MIHWTANDHLLVRFTGVFDFGSFFLGKLRSKEHLTPRCEPHAFTSFKVTDEVEKVNSIEQSSPG